MSEYALVMLDHDSEDKFSLVCRSKFSFFKKGPGKKKYVDLITGETISPRISSKEGTGLTYSLFPKTISVETAVDLLGRIMSIGEYAYISHIMEVKRATMPEQEESLRLIR